MGKVSDVAYPEPWCFDMQATARRPGFSFNLFPSLIFSG